MRQLEVSTRPFCFRLYVSGKFSDSVAKVPSSVSRTSRAMINTLYIAFRLWVDLTHFVLYDSQFLTDISLL